VGCGAGRWRWRLLLHREFRRKRGFTALIVTGIFDFGFGRIKTQIGGPTGAFVVVCLNYLEYGWTACTCTMLAGLILGDYGRKRAWANGEYFPRPVVVGFTNGIAI